MVKVVQGKTCTMVNLAYSAGISNILIVIKLKQPTRFLYFNPEKGNTKEIKVKIPSVDQEMVI